MCRRNLVTVFFLGVASLILCVPPADAAFGTIFRDPASNPGVTGFDFKNFEYFVSDVDGDGNADVGDKIRGVLQLQNNTGGIGGSVIDSFLQGNGAGNPEVSGVFEVVVLGKFSAGAPGIYNYVFGPSATFASSFSLPTNTIMAFYSDPVFEYTAVIDDTTKNTTDVENAIVDGSPILAAGFATSRLKSGILDSFGDTQTGDGYMYATLAAESFSSVGTSTFYYGLNVLDGFGLGSSGFVPILNTMQPPILGAGANGLGSDTNDFVGKGDTFANTTSLGGTPGSIAKYPVISNDPAGAYYVPEPSALAALVGLAICGVVLGYWRHCRK